MGLPELDRNAATSPLHFLLPHLLPQQFGHDGRGGPLICGPHTKINKADYIILMELFYSNTSSVEVLGLSWLWGCGGVGAELAVGQQLGALQVAAAWVLLA